MQERSVKALGLSFKMKCQNTFLNMAKRVIAQIFWASSMAAGLQVLRIRFRGTK